MAKARKSQSATVQVEHLSEGELTYIVVSGIIDESFDAGSKISSIHSRVVVINCARVNRVSSFGVRQWLQLIEVIDQRAEKLFMVECSSQFVDQLNMFTGFIGRGQVVSFYAPYACESCGSSRSILFRVDEDKEMIQRAEPPTFTCRTCRGQEKFDDDPTAYFQWFDQQGPLEIDNSVLALLRGRLAYSPSSQAARPQVEKYVSDNQIYVAIRGTLDKSLPTNKIVNGLEGHVVIDLSGIVFIQQSGLEAWESLLAHLHRDQAIERVYFAGLPPLTVERGTMLASDQGQHFTVLSVAVQYECGSCSAATWHQLPIAARGQNQLTIQNLPKQRCAACGSQLRPLASSSLLSSINQLPAPKVPGAVKRFVKKAPEKLEAQRARYSGRQSPGQSQMGAPPRALWAAVIGGLFVIGGAGAALAMYLKTQEDTPKAAVAPANEADTKGIERTRTTKEADLASQRPDWISSAEPASAWCFDTPDKSYCIGVSSYRTSKKEALDEAAEASLEELVSLLVLRASSDVIDAQHALYGKARQATLASVDRLRHGGGDRPELTKAFDELRDVRAAVTASLRATGGAAVPTQRSGSYWEEYERLGGSGTEFLGFVRIEISNAALDSLIKRYSETHKAGGATVAPAFPGLAWAAREPVEGVFVVRSGSGKLRDAGAKKGQVIRGVGKAPAKDPDALISAIRESGRSLELLKADL